MKLPNMTPLNKVCTKITDGAHASPPSVDKGMPMASVKDLTEFGINIASCRQISLHAYNNLVKADCKPLLDDILISKDGNSAINTACVIREIKDVVLLSSIAILRPDKTKISPFYLKHILSWENFKDFIKLCYTSGAAIPRVIIKDFKKCPIPLPPLPTQKKIAAILSAYDDLIENNNRRIAILEKMAEEIYKEWFVRMRLPGYEKVKVVKGVPEGWDVVKVKDIVVRKRFGRIYREGELSETGKVIVIDQSVKEHLGYYDGEPEHKASIENPIILFGDHSCKMLLMIEPFSLAENVIPFQSKNNIPIVFLFYLVHNLIETTEYKRHWTELINKSVFLPKLALQERYSDNVKNILLEKDKILKINQILAQSRNLLLPRLISGKLPVDNLDISFPPSMKEEEANA